MLDHGQGRAPHAITQYDRDQNTGLRYTPRSSRAKSRRINRLLVVSTLLTKRDKLRLGHQDADVVGLAIELQQFAAPTFAALSNDVLQHVEHRTRDALASVLGHENQVISQLINAVEKRAHVDVLGHCD